MAGPPLESRAFWLMHRMVALHKLRLQRKTAPLGMFAGQMPLLLYVERHPGCTQRDIAEALGVSTPAVATSVKRMQKAGMLEKLADEADMRCNKISITAKAQEMVKTGQRLFNEVCGETFAGISGEELQLLVRLLRRMEKNLGGDEFRGMDFFEIIGMARQELAPELVPGGPGPCGAPRPTDTAAGRAEKEETKP